MQVSGERVHVTRTLGLVERRGRWVQVFVLGTLGERQLPLGSHLVYLYDGHCCLHIRESDGVGSATWGAFDAGFWAPWSDIVVPWNDIDALVVVDVRTARNVSSGE